MEPLAIDLYCGLGGWAEGFLSEGWRVIGFDIERHDYGTGGYPGQLVIQDVMTLDGSQFRDAACIVASPPCQGYSYRAMPWKRAKALPPPDNSLFEACFRIQREASEAAGRYIPLIVENVRGAQKWVGRAKANFGSYYLWGDVGMVGRRVVVGLPRFGVSVAPVKAVKVPGFRFDGSGGSFQTASVAQGYKTSGMNWSDQTKHGQDFTRIAGNQAIKNNGGSWFAVAHNTTSGHGQNPDGRKLPGNNSPDRWEDRPIKRLKDAIKGTGGSWFTPSEDGRTKQGHWRDSGCVTRTYNSKYVRRKAASAHIAKIPFPLAQHIARCFV